MHSEKFKFPPSLTIKLSTNKKINFFLERNLVVDSCNCHVNEWFYVFADAIGHSSGKDNSSRDSCTWSTSELLLFNK